MGVNDREIYEMGFMTPSCCFCSKTAPRPKHDTSAETTVSRVGSNRAMTGAVVSARITSAKACHCGVPHIHALSLLRSSFSGRVFSARWGENFPN